VTYTDLTEFAGFVVRDAEKKISKKGTPYFEITVGWKQDDETRWVKTRVFRPRCYSTVLRQGH
jgi:hypothetical protein